MALEVVPLLGRFERADKLLQAAGCQQLFLGGVEIRADNEMGLDEFGDLILTDTAGGVVRGPVFGNCRPVVDLLSSQFFGGLRRPNLEEPTWSTRQSVKMSS